MFVNTFRSHIVDSIFFPIYHKLTGSSVWSEIQTYRKNQWLSSVELQKLQKAKLIALLKHCANTVPYYRELFRGIDFVASAAADPDQWRKVPFLTKRIINSSLEKLKSEDVRTSELIQNSTSGSTGETLRCFYDHRSARARQAAVWRDLEWASCGYADRKAYLWGAQIDLKKSQSLKGRFHSFITGDMNLSSYELSDESMNRYAQLLQKHPPRLLVSYPSPLETFADFLKRKGDRIPSIQAIITSAEQLYPWQRVKIEDVFHCRIFDRYGCREFGHVAHECHCHEGYHVNAERFFLEVIDQDGKPVGEGEKGEVVITDLDNYGFPMVRYQIGDIAEQTGRQCRCGRGLPLLQKIEGRSFDVIVCPNGNRVAGTFWAITIRSTVPGTGVVSFQVEQSTIDKLIVRIVKGEGYPSWAEEKISKVIKSKCGDDMKVSFEYVKEIPLTESGKTRFVMSRLAKDAH